MTHRLPAPRDVIPSQTVGLVSFNQPGIAPSRRKIRESIETALAAVIGTHTHTLVHVTPDSHARSPPPLQQFATVHNALHLWRPRSDPGKSNEGPRFSLPLPQQAPANRFTSGSVRKPPSPLVLQKQSVQVPHALPVRGHPQPGQAPHEDKMMPTSPQGHGHLSVCPPPPPLGGLGRDAVKLLLPSWRSCSPAGLGTHPGAGRFPAGRMLGQASRRRDKPPHGAGMLRAQATICPSPAARTAAQEEQRGAVSPAEGQGHG